MAKTKISEFSATPGNNTDIDGINIAEGCAPSGINDAIRELMAQLKDFQAGTAGDSFNGPVGTTTAAAGAFTTLTTSGAVTHNGGTANGVAYLNGSKVLTTGSALTFDGAQLGVNGITVGRGAGAVSTNTAVGSTALNVNSSGSQNTAVGYNSLAANTSGGANTAVGYNSLIATTTGTSLTGLGAYALGLNTVGVQNSAVGYGAMYNNTSGSYNTALGYQALTSNTTASSNTAVGYQAAYSNQTGVQIVALGYQAAYSTTGNYITALGYLAAKNNTTGSLLTAVGRQALFANTTGTDNSAVGDDALGANTTGSANTALGRQALQANTTASKSVAVGYQAGYSNTTGDGNTYVGWQAGYASTTAYVNTFIGYGAGSTVTTGIKNTILGGYNGNQGGLDIRTANNYIVLSDGDGNPQLDFNPTVGAWHMRYEAGSLYTYQANQLSPTSGTTYDMLTGIPNGTYLLSFDANGTYHYGGVWIYRHYDSADKTVTFLGGSGYGAAPTISDPSNTYNSGTVRVVPNQNYSAMAVRLWRLI